MILGYIACAGNAVLIKQIGGAANTRMHAYLMSGLTVLAMVMLSDTCPALTCGPVQVGWYIIHTNKTMAGKQHLISYHGQLGLVALLLLIVMAPAGWVFLNPDTGWMRGNQTIRLVHKRLGQLAIALGWVAMVFAFVPGLGLMIELPSFYQHVLLFGACSLLVKYVMFNDACC